MIITIKTIKMKKTIAAIMLIALAIACDIAPSEQKAEDSTLVVSPIVDTPVIVIDTLITPEGDTLFSPIQK